MRNPMAAVPDPNEFISNPGSPEKVIFSAQVQSDGSIVVLPVGKENMQDLIESARSTTDMAYIIKQLQLGDVSVLRRSSPQYGDFTQMPKSMAEAMQLQIDAEKAFYSLDVSVRAKFDHDFRRWLVSAGTEDWNSKMGFVPDPVSAPDPVKEAPASGEDKA